MVDFGPENLANDKKLEDTIYKSGEVRDRNLPEFGLSKELTFKKDSKVQSSRMNKRSGVVNSRIKLLDDKINRYKRENQEIEQELENEEIHTTQKDYENFLEEDSKIKIPQNYNDQQMNSPAQNYFSNSHTPNYFSNSTIKSKIGFENKNFLKKESKNEFVSDIDASRIIDQLEASNLAELSYNYELEKQRMMEMIKAQKRIITEMEQKIIHQDCPSGQQNFQPHKLSEAAFSPYSQTQQNNIVQSIPLTPIQRLDGEPLQSYFHSKSNAKNQNFENPGFSEKFQNTQNQEIPTYGANRQHYVNTQTPMRMSKNRSISSKRSFRTSNHNSRAKSNNLSFSRTQRNSRNHFSQQRLNHKDAEFVSNPLFDTLYKKKHEWSKIKEMSFNPGWSSQNFSHQVNSRMLPRDEYLNPIPVPNLPVSSRMNYSKNFPRPKFKKSSRKSRNKKRRKSRKSKRKISKSKEKRASKSRAKHGKTDKTIEALNYFVKGVRNLVESESEYKKFEPTCRGKSIRKKKNAIKLICRTLKGEKLTSRLKEAVRTARNSKHIRPCEKRRKKRKTKCKKHFNILAALNRLGGFEY